MTSTALKTIDIKELSEILGRTVETLYMDRKRRPDSVPPPLHIPGTKKLRWLESDVEEWLKREPPKPMGRPRRNH